MKKSLICTVLISTFLWGSLIACAPVAAQAPAEPVVFVDVSPDDWFYHNVMHGIHWGLIVGVDGGYFEPNRYITRAEFITMLGRLHEIWNDPIGTPAVGAFYEHYLEWAAEIGLIQGDRNGDLMPNALITHEQMAVIIHRYVKLFELRVWVPEQPVPIGGPPPLPPPPIYERPDISSWAVDGVRFLTYAELIQSNHGVRWNIAPQSYISRANALRTLHGINHRYRLPSLR